MNPALLALLGARAAGAAAWTPASIAGLRAWWDFSDAATLTVAADIITAATDKSGNGYDLAAPSGVGPLLATAWPGSSLTHARFTSTTGQRLEIATATTLGITSTGNTIFLAAKRQIAGQAGGNIDVAYSAGGHSVYTNTNKMYTWNGSTSALISSTTTDWTSPHVHTKQISGTAHSTWVDATLKLNANSGTAAGASSPVTVGGETSNTSDWDIAEMLVYASVLDATDRATVTAYLTTKWGIA